MSEVWMCEEHHGYVFLFSTRPKAETWLEKEVEKYGGREDYDIIEEHKDEDCHSIYVHGDLLARIERKVIDELG